MNPSETGRIVADITDGRTIKHMTDQDPGAVRTTSDARNEYIAKNVLVFLLYAGCGHLATVFVPNPITLYPAFAVGVAALFLLGLELWPGVFLAALALSVVRQSPALTLLIMPAAQALQAFLGAYILRRGQVDPLFRHSKDILWLFGMVACVSLIVPTAATAVVAINDTFFGVPATAITWGSRYTATVFCLLVLTPFFLRWFAKRRFKRGFREGFETVIVLSTLIVISYLIFIAGVTSVGSISLAYVLLVPLFWLALRLRPRFTTLGLVILSVIAISGLYYTYGTADPIFFNARLFATETFLIVIAAMFLLITSLEEDRRLSSNLLKSQISTLENAVSRISSESSAKNDFIAVLAHELRNPLAPIATNIEFMKLNTERDEKEIEMLQVMEDRMGVIKRLLDDLLDSSRISEGKITLTKEVLDMETILRRSVLSTEHAFHERHQTLVVNFPNKNTYLVEGDAVRLEQVFTNLLTNASKYSPSGERIELTLTGTDTRAIVKVKDKGIGIEPEVLKHIFLPFYQSGKISATKKGLGIGLALVRGFVMMHGGTAEAKSAGTGKGSEFIVTLPRTSKSLEAAATTPTVVDTKESGLRILVVDDNDAAAWGVGRLLELKGCEVALAYDAAQALEKCEDFMPDIVLLDISLPDQDGYTVARMMRTQGYKGRIIGLTGYSTEDAKVRGERAGFDAYLVKPAGLAELSAVIPEIA